MSPFHPHRAGHNLSRAARAGREQAKGLIREHTGSFPLALIPLATLTAAGSITTLLLGRRQRQRLAVATA